MVRDRNLANARAFPSGIDRDESVHFAIEADILDDIATIGFQRAPEVMKMNTEKPRDQKICRDRRQTPREHAIIALLAPAGYDIIAFGHLGQEVGDVGRIVLAVRIHGNDDVAGTMLNCGHERRRLAIVAAQMNDPDARIVLRELVELGG